MDVVFNYKDTISVKVNNGYNTCTASNVSKIEDAVKLFGFKTDDRIIEWNIKSVDGIPYSEWKETH